MEAKATLRYARISPRKVKIVIDYHNIAPFANYYLLLIKIQLINDAYIE